MPQDDGCIRLQGDASLSRIHAVNATALAVTGFPPLVWCQEPDFFMGHVHADDAAALRVHLTAVGTGDATVTVRFRHADGDYRRYEATVRHLIGPAGALTSVDLIPPAHAADGMPVPDPALAAMVPAGIHWRAWENPVDADTAAMSDRSWESFVRCVDGIVWEFDATDFTCQFISAKVEELLGYGPEEWLSSPTFWVDHLHPEDAAWVVGFCSTLTERKQGHEFEYRMIAADGRTVWLRDIVNICVRAGQPWRIRGVAIDITAQKHAQATSERALASAQAATAALQRMVAERDDFLSVLSHELRTPVAAMSLAVERQLRLKPAEGETLAEPALVRSLDTVRRQCRRLGDLVANLTNVSRLQLGALLPHPADVDLSEVVKETAAAMGPIAERAGSRLLVTCEDGLVIHGDDVYMRQILGNLLDNAVKFGRGADITLGLQRRGDEAELTVTDQGIGIAADQLGRIFERCARAVSAENFAGLGIGLYVVQQLVTLMDGAIAVSSVPGAGSTFTVRLPLQAASRPAGMLS